MQNVIFYATEVSKTNRNVNLKLNDNLDFEIFQLKYLNFQHF